MALTTTPQILQFSFHSTARRLFFSDLASSHVLQSLSPWPQLQIALHRSRDALSSVAPRAKSMARSTEEDPWSDSEPPTSNSDNVVDPYKADSHKSSVATIGSGRTSTVSYGDSLSLGIREPVYEVCARILSVCLKEFCSI